MWPLAWVLGFPTAPAFDGAMIPDEVIGGILRGRLSGIAVGRDELVAGATPRSEADVRALEDLFYCAHNAVRSAQLGSATVPVSFHPVVNGGVIHERRHALTWCLSPGVAWDDTDLAT